jgi:hypothetical protein
MLHYSNRKIFTRELSDALVSHKVFADVHKLLCDDDEPELDDDEDELINPEILAATQYAATLNFHYIYRETSYHTDVRRILGLPEWKTILLGYKYNEEEFLQVFRVPRNLFLFLVNLLKKHPTFARNGKKQRKLFSAELHLLVLLKYMGAEVHLCRMAW